MKQYQKPVLKSLDIYTQDIVLSSGIEKVDGVFNFGDTSDEYL